MTHIRFSTEHGYKTVCDLWNGYASTYAIWWVLNHSIVLFIHYNFIVLLHSIQLWSVLIYLPYSNHYKNATNVMYPERDAYVVAELLDFKNCQKLQFSDYR